MGNKIINAGIWQSPAMPRRQLKNNRDDTFFTTTEIQFQKPSLIDSCAKEALKQLMLLNTDLLYSNENKYFTTRSIQITYKLIFPQMISNRQNDPLLKIEPI